MTSWTTPRGPTPAPWPSPSLSAPRSTKAGGHAVARVSFRVVAAPAAYAYLLWGHDSTRHEMVLGEAGHSIRADKLCAAWALIHQHSLLHEEARRAWPRKVRPPE